MFEDVCEATAIENTSWGAVKKTVPVTSRHPPSLRPAREDDEEGDGGSDVSAAMPLPTACSERGRDRG
jgi:hypothetical protein